MPSPKHIFLALGSFITVAMGVMVVRSYTDAGKTVDAVLALLYWTVLMSMIVWSWRGAYRMRKEARELPEVGVNMSRSIPCIKRGAPMEVRLVGRCTRPACEQMFMAAPEQDDEVPEGIDA